MNSPKTGVILAAGRGKRLKELSANKPKPLVEVNGKSILSNLVESMIESGIQRIVLVVGYKADMIVEHLRQFTTTVEIIYIINEIWETTNNIYSLWLANEYLENGFLLFEADVVFDREIILTILQQPDDNVMLIDIYTDKMNGTVVTCDTKNYVTNVYLKQNQTENFDYSDKFKTVNFYKIGKKFYRDYFKEKLEKYISNNDVSYYYEAIIKDAIEEEYTFYGLQTQPYIWWEIDTKEDLRIAENIFNSNRIIQ